MIVQASKMISGRLTLDSLRYRIGQHRNCVTKQIQLGNTHYHLIGPVELMQQLPEYGYIIYRYQEQLTVKDMMNASIRYRPIPTVGPVRVSTRQYHVLKVIDTRPLEVLELVM